MKPETYDKIWKIIHDTLKAIENDTKGKADIPSDPLSGLRDKVLSDYCEYRDFVRVRHMMGGHQSRIDRHKVAACMACALLRVSPIRTKQSEEAERLLFYSNETLAFLVALSIMKSFTKAVLDSAGKADEDGYDKSALGKYNEESLRGIVDNGYKFPAGLHDNYLSWQLMALSDIENYKDFILSLSCILFLIEEYSIMCYEVESKAR